MTLAFVIHILESVLVCFAIPFENWLVLLQQLQVRAIIGGGPNERRLTRSTS